jgi:hypothetical protein
MQKKTALDAWLENLQKFTTERKNLKAAGLDSEDKMNLFMDLTEASANVAEKIERELRAEFERLLKGGEA